MRFWVGGIGRMLMAVAGFCLLPGCFGVNQNPNYFPYLYFNGDISQTHAKPPGHGYFANFDPHAVKIEVRPLESTDPVRTQHVMIATVYDEAGKPRRGRRVEWMAEGVGNIIEVDESGHFSGRGYKVDNKYAVSYTAYKEHRITRGNANPNDDFVIRPGQTWCVISSAVEGDTHMTVYAPGIANWDAHKVFVTQHWVDAQWVMPPPAINRVGTEHVLTTNVFKHTDRQPLANYRVRYRIIDGPPARFVPSNTQEFVAVSDLSGNAFANLVQSAPQPGINRIGIEIIRPPDPTAPSGNGILIGRGETTKEWQGAQFALTVTGPASAGIGQDIPYTITIANSGQIESQAMTVRSVIPDGLQFVRSDPFASVDGNQRIWTLGPLPGSRSHTIQVVAKALRAGPVTFCAAVASVEGFRDEKCATTQVGSAGSAVPPTTPPLVPQPAGQLGVTISDPKTGSVGVPVAFDIVVANGGSVALTGVMLTARFDPSLEYEGVKDKTIELPIGNLGAGQTRPVQLRLTPRQAGQFQVQVTATADGNLRAEAQQNIIVQGPKIGITKIGPKTRFVGQTVTWEITVNNASGIPVANVKVFDQLSPALTFTNATGLGQFLNGQVTWNLGALNAREKKVVQVTANCTQPVPQIRNVAVVTADGGLQEQSEEAVLEVRGVPAFSFDLNKTGDPVVAGGKVTYTATVKNTGNLQADQIEIVATLPKEMKVSNTGGPTNGRIDGNRVIFAPIAALQSGQSATYTVEVLAQQASPDVRVRIEVLSKSLPEPLIKETSTNILPANGFSESTNFLPVARSPRRPKANTAPGPRGVYFRDSA